MKVTITIFFVAFLVCSCCETEYKYPEKMPFFKLHDALVYKSNISTYDTFYVMAIDTFREDIGGGQMCSLYKYDYDFFIDTVFDNSKNKHEMPIRLTYYSTYISYDVTMFGYYKNLPSWDTEDIIGNFTLGNFLLNDVYFIPVDNSETNLLIDTIGYQPNYGIIFYTTSDSLQWQLQI